MSERRPFPPSPRRRALARQAGLHAASPLVGGALACGAGVLAAVMVARSIASHVGRAIAAACTAPGEDSVASALTPGGAHTASALASIPTTVLELAGPLLGAAAVVAFLAHVAQTRALWLPRRSLVGAPAVPPARTGRAAFELTSAVVVGAVAFGWLWLVAPRLARLVELDDILGPVGALLASIVVTLAIAWLALGVVDALLRHLQLSNALMMTATEKREDDRLAAADPRWTRLRRQLSREPAASPAVARAAVLLLGDDVASAIAWNATRQPVPLRTITGRGARATQLLALARRHRIPVHRDARLADALAGASGPVPEAHWPRLAEIIGALPT